MIDFSKASIDWSRRVALGPDGTYVEESPGMRAGCARVPVASLIMTASATVPEASMSRYPGMQGEVNRTLLRQLHWAAYGELLEPVYQLLRMADKNASGFLEIEEAARLRDVLLGLLKKP